jgi:hypothetical protein
MKTLYFLENLARKTPLAPHVFLQCVQMPDVAGSTDRGDNLGIA